MTSVWLAYGVGLARFAAAALRARVPRLRPARLRGLWTAAAALLLAAPALSESGRTGGAILRRTMGARAAGMARAFASMPGGPDAVWYNPAATAGLEGPTASASYLSGFASDDHGLLAYALPAGPVSLTGSLLYYNAGKIDLNLSNGTKGTVTAQEDTVYAFGASWKPFDRAAVGALYKFGRFRLADSILATGHFLDIGGRIEGPGGVRFGGAVQNLGTDITFESVGDPPPRTFRAGASKTWVFDPPNRIDPSADLTHFAFTLAADWARVRFEDSEFQIGAEAEMQTSYSYRFALRGGWFIDRPVESFTLGLGLKLGRLSFDYAFGGAKALSSNHQLTLGCRF